MSASQNRSESIVSRWHKITPTALLAVLGVIVSLLLFWAAYSWEMQSVRRDFNALADARCKEVSNAFQETAKLVDFMDNVFMVAPRVGTHAFAEYLQSLKKLMDEDRSHHPEINCVIWAPRVSRSERAAYEQSAKTAFGSNLQIGDPAGAGNTNAAAPVRRAFPPICALPRNPIATI
jgi:CHASE1-domain containing sensor protein